MPRIPVIMLNQGIAAPQGPQFPRNYNPGGGAAEAIGAAGRTVGESLFQAAEANRRQAEKEAHQEAGLMSADAEQRIGIADVQLRATQRDPDAYVSDYDKLVADTVGEVAKGAKNPQAAALMQQHLAQVLKKNKVAAAQHAQGLRTDLSVATLDATLDGRKTLAGQADNDTDFQRHYVEGENAIKLATPDIGANKAGDTLRKFKQDILGARALKEVNADPEGFVQDADTRFGRAGLDPKHLEELKQAARSKADQYRKERNHIADAAQKDLEAAYKRDVQSLVTDFDKRAAEAKTDDERAGVLRDLNMRVDMRQVEGEDARRIRAALEAPKDTPSDPRVLSDADGRTFRSDPAISLDELKRMRDAHQQGGKGLNQKDYEERARFVVGRSEDLKGERKTEENKRHNQAEQIVGRALGISSLYDKIDEQDKQLYDIALRSLTARSNAFDGKEDPIEVANQIVNQMAPVRQQRLKLKVQELSKTLMYPALDATSAMQRLNEQRATLPKSVIEQEERKIADMTRAEGAVFDQSLNKAAGGSSSKSGGGTLGRKPGDKPKTGTPD